MLSFIIISIFLGSSMQNIPDPDGWVPIEQPQVYSEESQEEEKGLWVVFSKLMDGEKFLVRLPDDPTYRYFPGGMQIDASLGSDDVNLRIEKRIGEQIEPFFNERIEEIGNRPFTYLYKAKTSADGKALDLLYRSGEQWVRQRLVFSSDFLYTFTTESLDMSAAIHQQFIDSFDLI